MSGVAVAPSTIETIKSLPVSSVLAAEDVFLRRVGREFVTHCLWHKDANPSLTVSDDKGFVFCHVCQHHDDALGFIQQKFGIGFADACERISSKHGIQIQYLEDDSILSEQRKQHLRSLYDGVEKLQKFYRNQLSQYPSAIPFIQSRNIKPETSRYFGLGYNHSDKRLTIPIKDYKGRIVGFSARTILNDIKPKYKNTENNEIFVKSNIVFNEYDASSHIREADECIFVEGHLDVITVWQAGIRNVVALQGTASPSAEVLSRLIKKTNRFVLCMDADEGGNKAIGNFLKSVQHLTLNGKLDVRIACLPQGKDPDDFIQSGGNLSDVISNASSWLDWILDSWLKELDFSDKLKIQEVERHIKELFSRISSPALRAHYYDKASIQLAQNKQALAAEIAKSFREHAPEEINSPTWKKPSLSSTRKMVEKRVLRLYIHKKEMRFILKPLLQHLHYPAMVWLRDRIEELEDITPASVSAQSLMAILIVSEQQYIQALRPVLAPSIVLHDNESSIAHMEDIMMTDIQAIEGSLS